MSDTDTDTTEMTDSELYIYCVEQQLTKFSELVSSGDIGIGMILIYYDKLHSLVYNSFPEKVTDLYRKVIEAIKPVNTRLNKLIANAPHARQVRHCNSMNMIDQNPLEFHHIASDNFNGRESGFQLCIGEMPPTIMKELSKSRDYINCKYALDHVMDNSKAKVDMRTKITPLSYIYNKLKSKEEKKKEEEEKG